LTPSADVDDYPQADHWRYINVSCVVMQFCRVIRTFGGQRSDCSSEKRLDPTPTGEMASELSSPSNTPVPAKGKLGKRNPIGHNRKEILDERLAVSGPNLILECNPPMMKLMMTGLATCLFLTLSSPAQADPGGQAGLSEPFYQAGGPFVGQWGAHGEGVTVNPDGTGVETSRMGTTNFTLGSVQTSSNPWDTAYGAVTDGNLKRGAFVTLQLVDGGQGMKFSAGGGDANFPFCKIVNENRLNSVDCGA
jgi:hypothetical protein